MSPLEIEQMSPLEIMISKINFVTEKLIPSGLPSSSSSSPSPLTFIFGIPRNKGRGIPTHLGHDMAGTSDGWVVLSRGVVIAIGSGRHHEVRGGLRVASGRRGGGHEVHRHTVTSRGHVHIPIHGTTHSTCWSLALALRVALLDIQIRGALGLVGGGAGRVNSPVTVTATGGRR